MPNCLVNYVRHLYYLLLAPLLQHFFFIFYRSYLQGTNSLLHIVSISNVYWKAHSELNDYSIHRQGTIKDFGIEGITSNQIIEKIRKILPVNPSPNDTTSNNLPSTTQYVLESGYINLRSWQLINSALQSQRKTGRD